MNKSVRIIRNYTVISPRNSTSFTRPFLAGRHARVGHKTSVGTAETGEPVHFLEYGGFRISGVLIVTQTYVNAFRAK